MKIQIDQFLSRASTPRRFVDCAIVDIQAKMKEYDDQAEDRVSTHGGVVDERRSQREHFAEAARLRADRAHPGRVSSENHRTQVSRRIFPQLP